MKLPHNTEAERGILGSILMDAEKVMGLCVNSSVTPDSFHDTQNKRLFKTLQRMESEGTPIDLLTVSKQADYSYVEGLLDDHPTPAHAEYYIQEIMRSEKLRTVIHLSEDAIMSAGAEDAQPEAVIAQLSEDVSNAIHVKQEKSIADLTEENIIVLENASKGIVSGIKLPWERFSDNICGVQRASVCPLVGRDGMGKSGALAQILDFWAGEEIPTLMFSLEDVARRPLLRMAGCRKWFSARNFEQGTSVVSGKRERMAHYEVQSYTQKMQDYGEWIADKPFWILDDKVNVEDICNKIRHYARVHKVEAVAIDGFKDIIHSKGDSTTAREKHIAQSLFKCAKDTGVAMIVVSHINKIEEGKLISKIDITGSGEQSKGARQMLIFQDSGCSEIEAEDRFFMSCTKNNFGGGGSVLLERDEVVLSYKEVL